MMEPLAMVIYRRFIAGESIEKLARELEIPADRIEARLRAAAAWVAEHRKRAA